MRFTKVIALLVYAIICMLVGLGFGDSMASALFIAVFFFFPGLAVFVASVFDSDTNILK